MFLREKLLLRIALLGRILDVQHIGSTAVPGMIAKPIIDILMAVPNYETAFDYVPIIEWLGYEYYGENSDLREHFFTKGEPSDIHLSLVEKEGKTWKERIAFRDLMLENSSVAAAYADHKLKLSRLFPSELMAYQKEKGKFVQEILQGADEIPTS